MILRWDFIDEAFVSKPSSEAFPLAVITNLVKGLSSISCLGDTYNDRVLARFARKRRGGKRRPVEHASIKKPSEAMKLVKAT